MKWTSAIALGVMIGLLITPIFILVTDRSITFSGIELALLLNLITVLVISIFYISYRLITNTKQLNTLLAKEASFNNQLAIEKFHFENLFHHINIGMALLAMDGKFIKVNKFIGELFGYPLEELAVLNYFSLVPTDKQSQLQLNLQSLLDKKLKTYYNEHQCYRKNGETIWILATLSLVFDQYNRPDYYILQVQNITSQKKAEQRLGHMAYHDPLTGLANRNKLDQFINYALTSAKRNPVNFALLLLDLDRFKNINDTIGHDAGDTLLQIVAERLKNVVRNSDIVARLGGDEFLLVITDVKRTENVAYVAQKILENILKIIVINGHEIYITTSIGISLFPYDGQSLQALMKHADLALYRAKEQGRNNYQFYMVEMTSKAMQKLKLQTALGHALIKNEFTLHYQPKMNLQTKQITGVEALLRWYNQEYKKITPKEIVTLAEETGLIIPVSEWVFKTACAQLKNWHDAGFSSLTMAVNCSYRLFNQNNFINDLLRIIQQAGLAPENFELEITEAIIMHDVEKILPVLQELKSQGIKIVIDDFGTGYWSLDNLRRLTVDKIKIDKSFIKLCMLDDASATMTKAIIALVNKLGIVSIAEGVETAEQYQFLKQEGCMEIQGFYLTQPLSAETTLQFLRHPIPVSEAHKLTTEKS